MTPQNKLLAEIERLKNRNGFVEDVRLDQCKKDIAIFKEMLEQYKWNLKDIDNKEIDEATSYCGNEVFMDMHNEDIDELYQQLEEAEKQ